MVKLNINMGRYRQFVKLLFVFFYANSHLSYGNENNDIFFKSVIQDNRFQIGVIDSLRKELFSEHPNFDNALSLIKEIRIKNNDSLVQQLKEINNQIKSKISKIYEKKTDPYLTIFLK
ncbi:hypothetical protein [Dyadobacter sp. NIV53]|uniref:hypothetical protein n=1 Tax=Dyadobacter sp. NIV53 TaxID=2861765 RepID=UPI001C877E28|nr:hypothetical protein [Dyadobacter sp. NIV53]